MKKRNFYILSNINLNSLNLFLDYKFIDSCSFNNFLVDLADKNSIIFKDKIDIIFFHLDLEELIKTDIKVDEIINLLQNFLINYNGIFILSNVKKSYYNMDTYLNYSIKLEYELNSHFLDISSRFDNVIFFDFNSLINTSEYTQKYWYLGRIKYTNKAFEKIAKEIYNLIFAYKSKIKKVLVLDLDNTLWGGVVGEEEIILSNDGIGKIYLDFQNKIKQLKEYGVLLAINSKNNFEDALKGLNHPMSELKEEDFIIKKINWQNKADNLLEIAQELNVGIDSLVFIDDNKVERELVKITLTDINVAEFPDDIFLLNSWFVEDVVYKYFPKLFLTQEDKKKYLQYEANTKRQKLSKQIDYVEFLKTLNIKLNFLEDDDRYIQRYAQLTQKTNQFNLTTKRYTTNDIKNFILSNNYKVLAVEYEDKFLKEGIVALAIIKIYKYVEIDTFLVSCRVLKREVEENLLKYIENKNKNKKIIGYYYKSEKNIQTKSFYTDNGYFKLKENKFLKENYAKID